MLLNPVLIPQLAEITLKGAINEFNIVLENFLNHHFSSDREGFYQIPEKRLVYLNDIILGIKEKFNYYLGSAPPPVSFLILSEKKALRKPEIIRAGKIYVEKGIRSEVEREFQGLNLFFKIIDREDDWFELILPSTVDPKLIFFYKDVFFSGKYFPCFFCGDTHHKFHECPGLLREEPRLAVEEALNLPFTELSQEIWEGVVKKDLAKLTYFLVRHFYLFPEFLKVVFFRGEDIENWVYLKIGVETPVRGGSLGIGLDALVKRDLKTAEARFTEVENDLRAQVGLFFVNLIKNEWDKSLYFLENALTQKTNHFLRSYLLFLKGYLHEYKRDEVLAQEFYKKALDVDRTCFPAFYRLTLVKYLRGESLEDLLKYFEHPLFVYWIALEPLVIREEKLVEEFLEKKITEKREQALQRLKETEDTYHKIKSVMPKEEQLEYEEKLRRVAKEIYAKGLGGIEKAGERALTLNLELQAYIHRKIKEIQVKLEDLKKKYRNLSNFWTIYPYKGEDAVFGHNLKTLGDLLEKVSTFMKRKEVSQQLILVFSTLKEAESIVEKLSPLQAELEKKWLFRKRLFDFIKTFTFLEILLVSVYILVHFGEIGGLQNFFNLPLFFGLSFVFLIFCLLFAYYKNPEL